MTAYALLAAIVISSAAITEVDLVSVDDRGFALTWVTDRPSETALVFGESPVRLDRETVASGPETRFHHLAVSDLSPGVTYYYRVRAGDALHPPPWLPASRVSTLVPPPGRLLFTFAVINDLHVGEDVAGLLVPPGKRLPALTKGFTWKNPVDNYWSFTLRAAVEAINGTDAAFTVANGDLASWYTREEFEGVKERLDLLAAPYYVVRGNHDRVGANPDDYFKTVFGLGSSWRSFDAFGWHFILLDDNRLEDGWHGIEEEQFLWFENDLAANSDKPTIIFCHRPLASPTSDLHPDFRSRALALIAANPQVAAVFNGHSHQARVRWAAGISAPFIEVPAVKEYPVGYGLARVHEGGLMYNFYFADCPDCREWHHVTRRQYFGLAPRIMLSTTANRSLVHRFPAEIERLAQATY